MLGTGYFWARTGFRSAGIRHRERANELVDALVARATEIAREARPV